MEMVQTIESLIKEGIVSEEKAPQFAKFYEDAKTGVIDFSYIKKDGSVRFARGTLNPELALKEGGITEDELFDLEEQFNLEKLKTGEIACSHHQQAKNIFITSMLLLVGFDNSIPIL